MNPVTRFMAVALGAIAFLIFCALLEGPDETQAAQDSADDTTAAQHLASDTAACSAHYGPGAQTFLLDDVHLVHARIEAREQLGKSVVWIDEGLR